jgi:hypothetical protein
MLCVRMLIVDNLEPFYSEIVLCGFDLGNTMVARTRWIPQYPQHYYEG